MLRRCAHRLNKRKCFMKQINTMGAVRGACGAPKPSPRKTDGDARLACHGLAGEKGIVTERSEPNAPIDRSSGCRRCR